MRPPRRAVWAGDPSPPGFPPKHADAAISVSTMTTRGGSDQVQNPVEPAESPAMEAQARNNLEPDSPMDVVEVIVGCKNGEHNEANCPGKSKCKDVVTKKVFLCRICRKNGNHSTANCPDKSTAYVWYQGRYEINYCDLCNKMGHLGELCPYNKYETNFDPHGSIEMHGH
ncbi:hypothetical protein M0R45_004995 [Rubus argutus]|uniref:Uncharacterized protein n=1 Tax=Rubus argutus TaxID=59490 RepID=A0AAW1YLW8_RUBAR